MYSNLSDYLNFSRPKTVVLNFSATKHNNMASEEESDIELQSKLPKVNNKKMPKSPSEELLQKKQEKKLSTKEMINQALIDLNSRKGVSLYAIKKYITEKYSVDTDKLNYFIKKYIKTAVENGSIVQTKGIGASGSFKLVPIKKKPKTDKKPKDKSKEKPTKEKDSDKMKKIKEKTKKIVENGAKKMTSSKVDKEKVIKPKKVMEKEKKIKPKAKDGVEKEVKVKKVKKTKEKQTPVKKKSLMKRKSVGSIIKKPKMKPAMKA
ncbi:histone H1.1, embryonic-like [Spodoptera litura]|uniref:Histone H1.1, embryonic-like n=1 Tax=Spodoptera litura TaxID=69820 RepID=A0A9J7DV49_SPOLT|nr:histone H1.1, embryonic-like [Spodoptera litura]